MYLFWDLHTLSSSLLQLVSLIVQVDDGVSSVSMGSSSLLVAGTEWKLAGLVTSSQSPELVCCIKYTKYTCFNKLHSLKRHKPVKIACKSLHRRREKLCESPKKCVFLPITLLNAYSLPPNCISYCHIPIPLCEGDVIIGRKIFHGISRF